MTWLATSVRHSCSGLRDAQVPGNVGLGGPVLGVGGTEHCWKRQGHLRGMSWSPLTGWPRGLAEILREQKENAYRSLLQSGTECSKVLPSGPAPSMSSYLDSSTLLQHSLLRASAQFPSDPSFRWPMMALFMIQTEIAACFACPISLHFSSCFFEKDLLGKEHEMSGSGLVFPTLPFSRKA